MISSIRVLNIIFFFLLSISITLYIYNQAFIAENNVFMLQTNEMVGQLITQEVESNIKSLTASIYGTDNTAITTDKINQAAVARLKPDSSREADFQRKLKTLTTRIKETLTWAAKLDTDKTSPLQWNKISVADLHILRKLYRYILKQPNLTLESIEKGHQCTEIQKNQQLAISKYITMDICSEVEWYKLAQLTFPEANLIFDVGGNKGYLGSLFVALWGGRGLKFNPALLYEQATKSGVWKGSRNPAGYCKDGLHYGTAMSCHNEPVASASNNILEMTKALGRDEVSGECISAHDEVQVHSFDGSSYLQSCVRSLTRQLAVNDPKVLNTWTYHHNAMSDTVGKVRFTKQGASQSPGFEG
jgi:hypothetical protein